MTGCANIRKFLLACIFASIMVCSLSCKDEENCKARDSKPKCEDFPDDLPVGPIEVKPNQRKAPCFNPNNGDEFIYVKYENNVRSLVKVNIINEEEEKLLENVSIVGQPSWGANDEIVFTGGDLRVYVFENHNSSLRQLTNRLESNHPKVYQDSLILFTVGAETIKGASGLYKINFNGARIDSIGVEDINGYNSVPGLFDCKDDLIYTEFGTENDYGIYSLDYSNRQVEALSVEPITGDNIIEGLSLFRDDFLFYSTFRTGIFRINLPDGDRICIKNSCDTRSYRHLSISPDGKRLLAERVDGTDYREDDGGYTIESKIVIMDIDGSNERVLFE
jgi:Tol biopolymer transport system component